MANIAPYSQYKRRLLNSNSLRFKTAEGSYIYAPAAGKVEQVDNKVVLTTAKGFVHEMTRVRLTKTGKVTAGERIGNATSHKVIYSRFSPSGRQLDAEAAILRDNGPAPERWMPGVERKPANGAPGTMGPGDECVVDWHTSEHKGSNYDKNVIYGVVNWVRQQESEYTLVWNPYTGQMVQLFPADVGARAMLNDGAYPVNRHGKIRIQICVIGRAAEAPLKTSPLKGRRDVMAWIDSWGVPRKSTVDPSRSKTMWRRSGHSTHRSAPGNDHVDPGTIDFDKLFAP